MCKTEAHCRESSLQGCVCSTLHLPELFSWCAQDNELQGTLVQRLQARVENMQRIALKVQNALDEIASALERLRAVVCWADPNASAFFLMMATAAALLVALLGLHTLISFLLCWMVRAGTADINWHKTPCRPHSNRFCEVGIITQLGVESQAT